MIALSAVPAYLLGRWFDRTFVSDPGSGSILEALT